MENKKPWLAQIQGLPVSLKPWANDGEPAEIWNTSAGFDLLIALAARFTYPEIFVGHTCKYRYVATHTMRLANRVIGLSSILG